jgi:uridine kinase
MPRAIIVVTGPSGSGKTEFSSQLQKKIPGAQVVPLDSFYLVNDVTIPMDINYDIPEAFDWTLFRAFIRALIRGDPARCPLYDFATHSRVGYREIPAADIVIIEGIMSQCTSAEEIYDSEILYPDDDFARDVNIYRCYVHADLDICLARRILRDTTSRGRKVTEVIDQWSTQVRGSMLKYVICVKDYADYIVNNNPGSSDIYEVPDDIAQVVVRDPSWE